MPSSPPRYLRPFLPLPSPTGARCAKGREALRKRRAEEVSYRSTRPPNARCRARKNRGEEAGPRLGR